MHFTERDFLKEFIKKKSIKSDEKEISPCTNNRNIHFCSLGPHYFLLLLNFNCAVFQLYSGQIGLKSDLSPATLYWYVAVWGGFDETSFRVTCQWPYQCRFNAWAHGANARVPCALGDMFIYICCVQHVFNA